MPLLLRRLAFLIVLLAFCAPGAALAAGGGGDRVAARVAEEAVDGEGEGDVDDGEDEDEEDMPSTEPASDPFCPDEEEPDEVDSEFEFDEDTEDTEADMVYEDEPSDLDDTLDFCSDGAAGEAATGSLKRALRGLSVPTDTMSLAVPGTITRTLRLSKTGLPKALRPSTNITLGSARKVAPSDGLLDLPVGLNKQGRKALRKAKRDVRLVLTSTQTLASGQSRTRTQNIVLKR